jgi:hypothetical protein
VERTKHKTNKKTKIYNNIYMKSFRKTSRSTKKNSKRGGLFVTGQQKYEKMVETRATLDRTVKELEEELRICNMNRDECYKKLSQQQFSNPKPRGGGFISSSTYHKVKNETIALEKRIDELKKAIQLCKEESSSCADKTTTVSHEKWNQRMGWVREESKRNTIDKLTPFQRSEYNRTGIMPENSLSGPAIPRPPDIPIAEQDRARKAFRQSEFNRTGTWPEESGGKRKTKKTSRKRKGTRRRH